MWELQVIGAKPALLPIARLLDDWFRGHPILLLFFVMIMCPLVMNIIQVKPRYSLNHVIRRGSVPTGKY